MKIAWLLLLGLFLLLGGISSCSSKKSESLDVSLQVKKDKSLGAYPYRGGLFKVWVKLPSGVESPESIRWKTGKGDIAERNSYVSKGEVIADTVYLHWESLPPPIITIDTIKADSTGTDKFDTTIRYVDSIGVVVDGEESSLEIVEILNILPRIDSVILGEISQVGDSTLSLSVHPGERMLLTLKFADAHNLDYPVQDIMWPVGMGTLELKSRSDTEWTWIWSVPNSLQDTVLDLKLTDKGGYGDRNYHLQLIVYDEAGSAWVISGSELVKFSPKGSEVLRIEGGFNDVSDLVLNSNTSIQNKLWIVDIGNEQISKYDAFGRLIWKDVTTLNQPYSVAIDVETGLVWVSSLAEIKDATIYSRVQRYTTTQTTTTGTSSAAGGATAGTSSASTSGVASGTMNPVGSEYIIAGPVRALSVDQFADALVWFVSPEADFVGFIRNGSPDARIFDDASYGFNRPSTVSYDPTGGKAWVADSSRVVVIDTTGKVHATITGFQFANALSSAGGVCWVADAMAGKVYKFPINMTGSHNVSDGLVVDGFINPWSVSTSAVDRSVWISDKGAGQVIRLDANGTVIGSGTGLTLPTLIRVHQVIE